MIDHQKISTPCIRYCKLKDGFCEGCGRSWEQIRDWTFYSEKKKARSNEKPESKPFYKK